MNVLSIDFDYYQRVSADTVTFKYPDGIDLGTELSTIVWATRYASYPELEKIPLAKRDFDITVRAVSRQTPKAVYVGQSHKAIYNFIKKFCDEGAPLHITHIDMHHDLFNNSAAVDCGNWLGHIITEYPGTSLAWIPNKISLQTYGFGEIVADLPVHNLADELKETKHDLIFLCRSDNWLPPHLDECFSEMATAIVDTAEKAGSLCFVEEGILEQRDYRELAESLSKQYDRCRERSA